MKRIRQHGTKPELAVRRALTHLGGRYRLNVRDLPGSPDVANKRLRKAVFVHGCFWHSHPGCRRATVPKNNQAFWVEKLSRNRARDRAKEQALRELGFSVLTIWECEAVDAVRVSELLREFWSNVDGST